MRALLVLLLCWPLAVFAVDRDLDDCTIGSTPTALAPLDLDTCDIDDGDDITGILTGLDTTYGNVYVRAPSRTLTVTSDTIAFTVDNFYFYEDQSAINRLTVEHDPSNPSGTISRLWSCSRCDTLLDYCPISAGNLGDGGDLPQRTTIMWAFDNFNYAKIGGSNLAITFVGTHPGLGHTSTLTCGDKPAYPTNELSVGLLDFRHSSNHEPTLLDFRANIRNSEAYGLSVYNAAQLVNGTEGRIEQVNIAGVFWNSPGTSMGAGVKNVWFDPDRTVFSDPYNRGYGWDGAIAATSGGRNVGCFDRRRSANGRMTNIAPYYFDTLTGGVTVEYGYVIFSPNSPIGSVGSAAEPFIVRMKDWGSSGPGTVYPAGVQVKASSDAVFFKGDPHLTLGNTAPFRFIRFISLPNDYGSGVYEGSLTNCAVGNTTDNSVADAADNVIRFEANDDDGITFGWDATFTGDWTTDWDRGALVLMALDPWNVNDRSYGHVLRAASDMTFTDTIQLIDTNTATGPGVFTTINVASLQSFHDPAYWQTAKDNKITDTNVSGAIAISTSTGTTTIENVNFTGAARAVITIATGSTAVVTDLCVPNGSTITGAGTLNYEGSVEAARPFYIPNNTTNCAITENPRPGPVTGGGVN